MSPNGTWSQLASGAPARRRFCPREKHLRLHPGMLGLEKLWGFIWNQPSCFETGTQRCGLPPARPLLYYQGSMLHTYVCDTHSLTVHKVTRFIIPQTQRGNCSCPHFTDGEAAAQRDHKPQGGWAGNGTRGSGCNVLAPGPCAGLLPERGWGWLQVPGCWAASVSLRLCVRVCICVCTYVYECVCVWQREKEGEKGRGGEREGGRDRRCNLDVKLNQLSLFY